MVDGGPSSGNGAAVERRADSGTYAGPLKRRKLLLQRRAEEARRRELVGSSQPPSAIPEGKVAQLNAEVAAEVTAEGVGEASAGDPATYGKNSSKSSNEPENTGTAAANPGPGTGLNVVGGTGGSGSDDAVLTAPAPDARGGSDGSGSGSGGGDVGGQGQKGSNENAGDPGDRTGSDEARNASGERPCSDGVGGSISDGGGHSGSGSGNSLGEKGSGAGNGSSDGGSGDGSGSGRWSVSGTRPVSTHHRQEGGSEFPAGPANPPADTGKPTSSILAKFRMSRKAAEQQARVNGGGSSSAATRAAAQVVAPAIPQVEPSKALTPARDLPRSGEKHPAPEPSPESDDKAGSAPPRSNQGPVKRARVDVPIPPPVPEMEKIRAKEQAAKVRKIHANSVANLQRVKKCPECGHIYGNKMGGREGGTQCTTMVHVLDDSGKPMKTEHGQPVMRRCPYVFMSSAQRKVMGRKASTEVSKPPDLPPIAPPACRVVGSSTWSQRDLLPVPTLANGFFRVSGKVEKDLYRAGSSVFMAMVSPTSTSEFENTELQELAVRESSNGYPTSLLLLRHYAGPAAKVLYAKAAGADQGTVEAPLRDVLSEIADSEDTPATTSDSPNESSSPNGSSEPSDPGAFGSFDPQMSEIKDLKSLLAAIKLSHYHAKLIAHGLDLPGLMQTVKKSSSGPRALASITGIPMGAACKIAQTVLVLQDTMRTEATERNY